MPWIAYILHFIAAALVANGIPHFVSRVRVRRFRTPLSRASGGTFGSPAANVIWGWLNFLVAFLLFANFGPLYIGTFIDTIFVAAGMLLMGLVLARVFSGDKA